jgi:homoserine kinase type II
MLELVGVPGAGKTTVAPLVVGQLRDRGLVPITVPHAIDAALARSTRGRMLRAVGVRPPYRRRARVLLVDAPSAVSLPFVAPRLAAALAGALLRLPVGWGHRVSIGGRAIRVVAAHRFLRSRLRPGEVAVADEGPVHRVVNLYAWRRSTAVEAIRRYLDSAPLPDAVLEITVPGDEATRRLRARESGLPDRLRGADDARVRQFAERADASIAVAREHLAARTAWATLSGTDRSDADVARRLDELGFVPSRGGRADPSSPVYRPLLGVALPRPGRGAADRRRPIDPGAIPAVVRDGWGLSASGAEAIGRGGRSDSLLVERAAGGRLVLKRYKASVDPAAVDCEQLVLRTLQDRGFPAPRLVPAATGELVVCDADGRRWAAFEVIDGRPLHARMGLPGDRRRSARLGGRALGALHAALAGIDPPDGPETGFRSMTGPRVREIGWYLDRLTDDGRASDTPPLSWAREMLAAIDDRLGRVDLARGVIHGDYGPYNLLVRPGRPVAVIDFELTRLDWLLTDLATATPRFAAGRLGFSDSAARAFIEGYRSRHPLDDAELRALPDVASFLALRRAAVAWSRHLESGEPRWLAETNEKLALARAFADGRHGLVRLAQVAR